MKTGRHSYPGENKWKGLFYLLPALLIYLGFTFIPILETFRASFFDWNGFTEARTFIGFKNYINLFSDPLFLKAISNNLVFIIFYSIIPILIGLMLAAILTGQPIPGFGFFRTVFFLPQVISMVVVGVIWRWMFNPVSGPINQFLSLIGLDHWRQAWLGSFEYALPAVGSIGTWVQYGFCMVLFLAGMQRIPTEYYEAASLDGANGIKQFRHITIPGLKSEIGVAMITTMIAALRVFDLIYSTTRGGPGDSTLVTGFLIYRAAILNNRIGYGAAIATVLTIIILALSLLIRRFMAEEKEPA
ncbi:MAG: sugar ABC transporter permease [Anaerolineaceae bacterium]|nr:sugar ABC transporter permease [Anaerolineaceae bacterium]MDD4041883.1 sugar ABC transporter permease [Anaerolineaceae bacterium]MDD4577721.1 sugar ABC transporter permease [Anaerolineaceae bacterium]